MAIATKNENIGKNHIFNKSRKLTPIENENKYIKHKIKTKKIKKKSIVPRITNSLLLIIFISLIVFSFILNLMFYFKYNNQLNIIILEKIKNISFLIDMNTEKKVLKNYIKKINLSENDFAVLVSDQYNIIGKDNISINEINQIINKRDKIYNKNTIINKLLKTKEILSDFITNKYFSKSMSFKEYKIFYIYKPFELTKNMITFLIIYNLIILFATMIFISFLIYSNLKISIQLPLRKILKNIESIKKGDLTIDLSSKKTDEIGQLSTSIMDITWLLKDLIQHIYITVITMSKILRHLYKSSSAVSDSANAQAITIEQTQGNFEKLNSMVKTITEESSRGNTYTTEAFDKAKIGMETIQNLEREMSKIESSSQEITDIIRIINDIAEQTELLSLNASIESARAGEAGRGFNVVAGEVRKLAEKTSQAANRVYDLITTNNNLIREGVTYSKNATKILKDISMSNELSASIVKTISDEIEKVKQSSNEIMGVINYISEVAQANLMESEHVSNTTGNLGSQAISLQKFIKKFDNRSRLLKENQSHIEKLLKTKLIEVNNILKDYGTVLLPTGDKIRITGEKKDYEIDILQLGDIPITNNNDFADMISKKTGTFVTFFQRFEENLISISTTIRNYDNTRTLGSIIKQNTEIYNTIMDGQTYYGRVFIVNRWYITVYKPITDQTGYIQGIITLGLPEETDLDIDIPADEESYRDGIIMDNTFKHNY